MPKLVIEDLPSLKGKKVLMRVDFNVPLDSDGNVTDATRIESALPSIKYILEQGGSVILMSHLGRPHNSPDTRFSLAPCAKVLAGALGRPVIMAPDCIGYSTQVLVNKLQPGEVLLLENLRFHRAEEHPEEGTEFARELASYGDFYVNDAFGSCHRKHSSVFTITQFFPGKAAAGFLLEKEIHYLGTRLTNPKRPFYSLIGGAKVSSKIGVIKSLLKKVDTLLVGGGMAYTFLKAQGMKIGNSLCDDDALKDALATIELAKELKIPFLLPIDFVIANDLSETAETKVVTIKEGIPDGYQGLDIGPDTVKLFAAELKKAATILWNGPVGVFELAPFSKGTHAMALALSESSGVTVVGGGDSVAAIMENEVEDKITHLSTGGGAALEFIEFGSLPGIEALSDAPKKETV